ncbi:hypothetical protein IEN85_10545 [Pelagicoccus sp. NFK12]|uniref:Uncharacterized protein n=1 Tax=Pelagicoccus enzymogenes TaxID=2773457 RepID=A0A927F7J6_9BACT|nr:hypothetical protein [Pelagicoccus enzymogenes]MBD5779927.1 hypothetical protein [Pelagicoccus enzymogenes]
MGTYHTLVNLTKKETLSFAKVSGMKAREITGNPASSAMVTWYMLKNSGDRIGFMPDDGTNPFVDVDPIEIQDFEEKEEEIIDELLREGILVDCGSTYLDDDDPSIFSRDLRNGWMPEDLLVPKNQTEQGRAHNVGKRPPLS